MHSKVALAETQSDNAIVSSWQGKTLEDLQKALATQNIRLGVKHPFQEDICYACGNQHMLTSEFQRCFDNASQVVSAGL